MIKFLSPMLLRSLFGLICHAVLPVSIWWTRQQQTTTTTTTTEGSNDNGGGGWSRSIKIMTTKTASLPTPTYNRFGKGKGGKGKGGKGGISMSINMGGKGRTGRMGQADKGRMSMSGKGSIVSGGEGRGTGSTDSERSGKGNKHGRRTKWKKPITTAWAANVAERVTTTATNVAKKGNNGMDDECSGKGINNGVGGERSGKSQ
jgi:hypothetical protein